MLTGTLALSRMHTLSAQGPVITCGAPCCAVWSGSVKCLALPPSLALPVVGSLAGSPVGFVNAQTAVRWGVPTSAVVGVPFGDNQSAVLATLSGQKDAAALTVGTAAQLSIVLPPATPLTNAVVRAADAGALGGIVEVRPFVGDQRIAVCAVLNGVRVAPPVPSHTAPRPLLSCPG
jgi:hypothetical protein